ncbi:hypothetical protein Fuma_05917 [Fuerstiella marisgermanici]|uniref:Uncharacterized protein n=1 Tax=Fuerstiella marisgermanici TaxID=1891926 RepID=A0A1P8WQB6_9PLAN|nr:hypothetical protein Fuma_05917 [Fuerstiella marisgermanici]
MSVSLSTAIAEFRTLAQRLQARPPLPPRDLLDLVIRFYADVRVDCDYENNPDALDELVLARGAMPVYQCCDRLIDLRDQHVDCADITWERDSRQYIWLLRHLVTAEERGDRALYETSVQLCVELYFSPEPFRKAFVIERLTEPSDIHDGVKYFCNTPAVRELLNAGVFQVCTKIAYYN